MSGYTAQDSAWKAREQGQEAQFAREREREQLQALKDQLGTKPALAANATAADKDKTRPLKDREDIEGGFGGQEDLEDRYATTSGEH